MGGISVFIKPLLQMIQPKMSLQKKRLFLSILLFGITYTEIHACDYTLAYTDSVRLTKAIIQDSTLYVVVEEISDYGVEGIFEEAMDGYNVHTLKAFTKGHKYPINTVLDYEYFDRDTRCWDIDGLNIYTGTVHESLSIGKYRINKSALRTLDSVKYLHYVKGEYEKHLNLSNSSEKAFDALFKDPLIELSQNVRSFRPARDLYRGYFLARPNSKQTAIILGEIKNEDRHFIDVNIIVRDNTTIWYFVKDKRQMTLWEYSYPPIHRESSQNDWREIRTWCVDSIVIPFPADRLTLLLPTVKNTSFNAIADHTLLEHHFEVVNQNGHTFLVNSYNGHLYWLANESIVKIGKINIDHHHKSPIGHKIFIEDRDRQVLLFFSEVIFDHGAFEYPKVEIINNEEKYQYILKYFE